MTAIAASGAGKLSAFVRRDVLIALSYRAAFVGEALQIAAQVVMFALVAEVVDAGKLPQYGGVQTGYLEFVVVGSTMTILTGTLLARVAISVRQEQLYGTFEALLMTPTRLATIQAGAAALDIFQVPLRLAVYLGLVAVLFGLDLEPSGILPAVAIVAIFTPFAWGLGLLSGGAMVTFRRGGAALGTLLTGTAIASGVYFPLSVLPDWLENVAEANPFAIVIEALRDALIGGAGWSAVDARVLLVLPLGAAALTLGWMVFRWAVERERRRGTVGVY